MINIYAKQRKYINLIGEDHYGKMKTYCGIFTPCKHCNIETRSRDYATVNKAVFSPSGAEP
jgi:hypothetical protein